MWAAQRTGMKVRRYFVGFGPTLWSTHRGGTEYGVKALPLGGFCDIAGMTPYDELTDEEKPRAMYLQKAWKRLVVLLAGPAQNFILGFVLIFVLAVGWGLPNLNPAPVPAKVDSTFCVTPQTDASGNSVGPCVGPGPAAAAGLRAGDEIVAVNGTPVSKAADLSPVIQKSTGPIKLTVKRNGVVLPTPLEMTPTRVTLTDKKSDGTSETVTIGRVGLKYPQQELITHYNVLTAIPASIVFTGDLFKATWDALLSMPTKIASLWRAVTGGVREADTPISVYGASVLGGQAAEHGNWEIFLMILISINFFLGLFNLVPLLPLDGGHMAIVGYEKGRNFLRRKMGKTMAGPVDYMKLMPLTYGVVIVLGAFMVLTLTADIVNPITLY